MVDQDEALELAAELTIAWLDNPNTRASVDDASGLLLSAHAAIAALVVPVDANEPIGATTYPPATSVRKSLASRDHILSMIDGKPYKALRRHLAANGLAPDEYRERYGLKPDYPMVAPGYSEQRSAAAKSRGLGRKPAQVAQPPVPEPGPAPRRGRRKRGIV